MSRRIPARSENGGRVGGKRALQERPDDKEDQSAARHARNDL